MPISSPLKPAAISSAPTLGSVIALALTGQGVPVSQRGLEQRAAEVDVAGVALLVADVLVVDRDDALLGVDHAVELVLVGDLDERRQPVAERGLDQLRKRRLREDPRGQQDRRRAHLLGAVDLASRA